MSERVRFSPSPTGALHVGGARTALYNWVVARQSAGSFIVRIEDTDPARSVPGAEEALLEDLRWLGLTWDEGPEVGGPHAPYRQSERAEAYQAALRSLADAGRAYPCFCTPEALARERDEAVLAGRPPRYGGRCRAIDPETAARRCRAGEPHAWRFAVEPDAEVVVGDLVFGQVAFRSEDIGDFVVLRSDGRATYDLACVVDDTAMGVTTVIRGADHLSNTPRQLLIYGALGAAPPRFAHLPLVTAPGGEPLSKSAGATAVSTLRERGYLPSAVVHHCALLGWSDPDAREVLTLGDLLETFSLERVSTAPAVHDEARLRALNARHLRALSDEAVEAFVRPYLGDLPAWLDAHRLIRALRPDLVLAGDAVEVARALAGDAAPEPEAAAFLATEEARAALRVAHAALVSLGPGEGGPDAERAVRSAAAAAGMPAGLVLRALRAALLGRLHGPRVSVLLEVVPADEVLSRVARYTG